MVQFIQFQESEIDGSCQVPLIENVEINTQSLYLPPTPFPTNLNEISENVIEITTPSKSKATPDIENETSSYFYTHFPVKSDNFDNDVIMDNLPDTSRSFIEQKSIPYSTTDSQSNSQISMDWIKLNHKYEDSKSSKTIDCKKNNYFEGIDKRQEEFTLCRERNNSQKSKANKKVKKSKIKYFLTPEENNNKEGSTTCHDREKDCNTSRNIDCPSISYDNCNLPNGLLWTDANNNDANEMDFKIENTFDDYHSPPKSQLRKLSSDDISFNEMVSKRTLREKMLPPEIRGKRRQAANARERKRVNKITDAFERLREHVPNLIKDRKLSKFETLQMAMAYIDALDKGLKMDLSSGLEPAPLSTAASQARIVVAQSSAKWRLQRWLENKLGMSKKI